MKQIAFLLALFVIGTTAYSAERPNIIHIVADDLGWNDVGFHGSEINTPTRRRWAQP